MLQNLTTREPDREQLAVAIAALEAVLAVESPEEAAREAERDRDRRLAGQRRASSLAARDRAAPGALPAAVGAGAAVERRRRPAPPRSRRRRQSIVAAAELVVAGAAVEALAGAVLAVAEQPVVAGAADRARSAPVSRR